jgi:hypothetical protein
LSVRLKGYYFASINKNKILRYQMKKNLFFYLFAVLCTVSLFTSCSDNDEPAVTVPVSANVAGNYKGALNVTLKMETGDVPAGNVPAQLVSVTNAGENTVDLKISNFSFSGMQLGDIEVSGCQLTDAGNGKYTFTATSSMDVTGLLSAGIKANGVFEDKTLTLDLDIDDVKLMGSPVPYTVKVAYSGTKLSGTESSEAKILSFVFDKEVAAANAVVMGEPVIDETSKTIKFTVNSEATAEELAALVPTIEVSEKATVTPASGEVGDFSNGKTVTYIVTAENGSTAEYVASVSSQVTVYGFETWVAGVEGQEPDMTFYNPDGWCSSNAGVQMLKGMELADHYAVEATNDAHSGEKAALITSVDTKGKDMYFAKAPKVTTGSLFLGTFITDIFNTLNSTKFGIPYSAKPVSLKGWYKYTPGPDFYVVNEQPYDQHCHEAVLDKTKTDEFMISVVLYETEEYDTKNWSDCLTGVADTEKNIYTSSRVAAIAQLTGGEQTEWKEFNLTLDWKKEYNADTKYRMAIICSASKDGDKFWGAPGSTLIVDDFELVAE